MVAAEMHALLSFLRFYFRVWNSDKGAREHYVRQFFSPWTWKHFANWVCVFTHSSARRRAMAAAEMHALLSFLRFYFRVWNSAKGARERYVRQKFRHVHASILQTGCVSFQIHLRGAAPWQQLRFTCC